MIFSEICQIFKESSYNQIHQIYALETERFLTIFQTFSQQVIHLKIKKFYGEIKDHVKMQICKHMQTL